MTRSRVLTGAISTPSNGWSIPSTGCERIEIPIGRLRSWNIPARTALRCGDFQRNLKAKRGMSSFGSKEGLMRTDASESKSKGRGFKIFRGIVRRADGRRLDLETKLSARLLLLR